MARRLLILIRHGQHNHEEVRSDELEGSLTNLGRLQAQLTARRLRGIPVNTIHYSTMRRAAETADIICGSFPDTPAKRTRLLWECVPFVPANFADEFIGHYSPSELAAGRFQAYRVFTRFFRRALRDDKVEVIVSHGNLIRYLVLRAMQVSPALWGNLDICNCSLTEIVIEPDGRMVLVSFNDTGHLPGNMRTFS